MLPVSELNRLRREAVSALEVQRGQPKRWKLEPVGAGVAPPGVTHGRSSPPGRMAGSTAGETPAGLPPGRRRYGLRGGRSAGQTGAAPPQRAKIGRVGDPGVCPHVNFAGADSVLCG